MSSLFSLEALSWLASNGYADKSHEERMALIEQAKQIFPEEEDCDDDDYSEYF